MPIDNIVLLYSNLHGNESKLARYLCDEDCCWTYLGPDYLNYLKIEKYIDNKLQYIEISEKLDNISNIIRDDFTSYVDSLNLSHKDSFEWWFTPLSSRNPSMSGIFQNVCFLELLKNLCTELNYKILIVVAENYSIGHSIESHEDYLKTKIFCMGKPVRTPLHYIASGLFWIGKCLFKAGLNYVFAKLSALNTKIKPKTRYLGISGKTCMIDVFVYEKNFSEDGGFADRYFPGLESFLIEKGYNVVYYPTFAETKLNKYSLYRKARANDRVFLIEQDFLQIGDYFKAVKSAILSVRFTVNSPLFNGLDICKIDDGDFKWDCFENIFKAYLQYYAFLRMSETLGDKFERIISWHENQLQDKALCKAVHETFKGCKIIGSHAYIHFSNYLYTYPIDSEAIQGYTPDVILSLGNSEVQKIKKHLSKIECYSSASLRYSNQMNISICNNHPTTNTVKNILVFFPYIISDTKFLLTKIREIDSVYGNKTNFILKCHPDYGVNTLKSIFDFGSINAKIQFTEKDIYSIYSSTCINAVISMSSSIIVESASLGMPTIVMFNPNSLTYDPFEGESWINVIKCYNNSDLISALEKFFAIDDKIALDFQKEGEMIRNAHFYLSKSNDLSAYLN